MKSVKLLLVGIGGYAYSSISALLDTPVEGLEIAGLVDPYPNACKRLPELLAKNIPLYNTMEEFYKEHTADLAVITTPIQFHTEHILTALSHGSHVLCEKPLCADEKDIEKILKASREAGRFVDIGYQWSHDKGIRKMKSDILNGVYGKPVLLKSLTLWPRNAAYFKRGSGWAGKLYDGDGRAVFDSVANNATAHYLHNIFFLCGPEMNSAASPSHFDAVLLRTNPIETFDTCLLTGTLENGADFIFATSHAVNEHLGPVCEYKFEKGTIRLSSVDHTAPNRFIGTLDDGTVIDYGDPFAENVHKLWLCIEDARENRLGAECCPAQTAAVHTRVINRLHRDFKIHTGRKELTCVNHEGDAAITYIKGLDQALISAYEGKIVDLTPFTEVES